MITPPQKKKKFALKFFGKRAKYWAIIWLFLFLLEKNANELFEIFKEILDNFFFTCLCVLVFESNFSSLPALTIYCNLKE